MARFARLWLLGALVASPTYLVKLRFAGLEPNLLEVFVAAGGTHDNWAEYDRVMAAQRRAAVFVHADRILSNG